MRRDKSPFNRSAPDLKIVRNEQADEAEILIYDEIGFWGIVASDFKRALAQVDAKTIHVRINSPGGSVFDGIAIYNALREHPAHVVTHIDSLAASIASVIALAGDEVKIAKNAYMMIHDPWTVTIGNAEQLRKDAGLLDKFSQTILDVYAARSSEKPDDLKQLMHDETWLTADEALDMGLVDEVVDTSDVKAQFDLSVFAHVPAALAGSGNTEPPNIRDLERSLRDAGLSRSAAKAVLASGYQALEPQRDAALDEAEVIAAGKQLLATLKSA
jgi:ATP-dependent Clp protease protease subunit